jgi:DNA-binding transcriptional MerR regulator
VYRRTDVERAFRIRQLVFDEGLTLAGVRRRLDQEKPQPDDDEGPTAEATRPIDSGMRIRIERARQGLRGVLDLLDRATPLAGASASPSASISSRSEGTDHAGAGTVHEPAGEPVSHDDVDSPSRAAGGELFDLDGSAESDAGAAPSDAPRTRKPSRRRKADAPA